MTFEELIPDLFELLNRAGARPDFPIEAETFFSELVASLRDRDECRRYLEEHLTDWFRSLAGRPEWLQGAEWQWAEGKPMTFVGSLDAPAGTFHDDARFYLFWSPETGIIRCIIQVS